MVCVALNWSVQRWLLSVARKHVRAALTNRLRGSDHWTVQMTCLRGTSSVKPRCLVPLLVCLASHISAVHTPHAMYVIRAVSRSRFREILTHLRASGRRYQYAWDSRNFRLARFELSSVKAQMPIYWCWRHNIYFN